MWKKQSRYRYRNKKHRNYTSKGESKLRKVVKSLFPKETILYNDRKTLHGLEIDVYIPSIKLGFEFNGGQHYTFVKKFHGNLEGFYDQVKRDELKRDVCKHKGIRLITIKDNNEKKIRQIVKAGSRLVNYQSETKVEGVSLLF